MHLLPNLLPSYKVSLPLLYVEWSPNSPPPQLRKPRIVLPLVKSAGLVFNECHFFFNNSNDVTFWKWQNYGDVTKTSGGRERGESNDEMECRHF